MFFKDLITKPAFLLIIGVLLLAVVMFIMYTDQTANSQAVSVNQNQVVATENKNIDVADEVTMSEVDSKSAVKSEAVDEAESAVAATGEKVQTITLAGGCFWCIEGALQDVEGVIDAVSGYAGADAATANYLDVSKGKTGHREVVQITYDSSVISTAELLNLFWAAFDPTDAGGQFADRGFQYTTAIFYHTDEQREIAEESLTDLDESGLLDSPVVTAILPFSTFFAAEEYHQDYYQKSSAHYERYKKGSGRSGFIEDTWARDAAKAYFEEQEKATATTEAESTVEQKTDYSYTDEEIEELLKNLDPLAYHVVAENGTESPFNNKYWDNKADGIYVDIVTGEPLFSSTHKYDSGTGWPSFWRTIDDDSVTLHEDNSLSTTRTEVRSAAGHVGHVFNDGPVEEGGRRFCTNSASLLFVPKAEMQEKNYGEYLYFFE